MKTANRCILTLLLFAAIACSKHDTLVDSSATAPPPPSMSGGWGITWLGWYGGYSGTLSGTMTLTEKDSTLSGSIFIHNQTFPVAGFISSAYEMTLSGIDGGYDYSIIGTANASKSAVAGKVTASPMGAVPKDTIGSAMFSASRYK